MNADVFIQKDILEQQVAELKRILLQRINVLEQVAELRRILLQRINVLEQVAELKAELKRSGWNPSPIFGSPPDREGSFMAPVGASLLANCARLPPNASFASKLAPTSRKACSNYASVVIFMELLLEVIRAIHLGRKQGPQQSA